MLDCRAQLMACSTVVVMTFSSIRASMNGRFIVVIGGPHPAGDLVVADSLDASSVNP
jgi:hypothetical protein